MTTAAIFTAAHAAARLADAVVAYRARFVAALKSAWAAAKQTIKSIMEAPTKLQTNEFQITVMGRVLDCVIWNKVAGKERIYIRDNDAFRAAKYGADFAWFPLANLTPQGAAFQRKGPYGEWRAPLAAALQLALQTIEPITPAASASSSPAARESYYTCLSCGSACTAAEVKQRGGYLRGNMCECGC